LATLYAEMGDYGKAERLGLDSLKVVQDAGGERHPRYTYTLRHLAQVYLVSGKTGLAEEFARKALLLDEDRSRQWFGAQSDDERRGRIEKLSGRKQQLEEELARGNARLLGDLGREPLTPAAVAEALPDSVVFVDFISFTQTSPAGSGERGIHQEQRLLAFIVA